jgi:DNA replicative helicase MCM subunit Mcm2 (Cdc46/Mcm family)
MEALQRLRLQLDTVEGEDVRSAKELIDKLLETQIRIEQERY